MTPPTDVARLRELAERAAKGPRINPTTGLSVPWPTARQLDRDGHSVWFGSTELVRVISTISIDSSFRMVERPQILGNLEVTESGLGKNLEITGKNVEESGNKSMVDDAYIAGLPPDVVLGLLDRLAACEEALAEIASGGAPSWDGWREVRRLSDLARAALGGSDDR